MERPESDLAMECGVDAHARGVQVSEQQIGGCRVRRVHICTAEAARGVGKPQGRYVTVTCDSIKHPERVEMGEAALALAVELRTMAERMTGRPVARDLSVLVAGLGNANATPDSLGALTVSRLSVTHHLTREEGGSFCAVALCRLAAVATGVAAQTGVESATYLRGLCSTLRPHLVVAVDALCAKGLSHVCGTVQLSDVGVQPGSGVGRGHAALTRESIGVPVLALGVPTAVRAAVLVRDLLEKCEYFTPFGGVLPQGLEESNMLVSPCEMDFFVSAAADLLVMAIERAFTVEK